MPRYFFHLHAAGRAIPDENGTDLPDIETAHLAALESIKGIMNDPPEGADFSTWSIEVADAEGCTILQVPFRPKMDS